MSETVDTAATLAAETGVAIFRVAFDRWVADPTRQDLPGVIEASLDELRAVAAAKPRRRRRATTKPRRRRRATTSASRTSN